MLASQLTGEGTCVTIAIIFADYSFGLILEVIYIHFVMYFVRGVQEMPHCMFHAIIASDISINVLLLRAVSTSIVL